MSSIRASVPTNGVPGVASSTVTGSDIGPRLDRLPSTWAIWHLVVLVSLGGFFEFYELFATAYVAPGIVRSGILTVTTASFFGFNGVASFIAAAFAGLFVGTFAFGAVADKAGRRTVFTFALLWYSVSSLVMAFQETALGLNFWRFMTGIGLGVELVTIDVYLAELVPTLIRGKAFALSQFISYLAVPTVALLSWRLVPLSPFGLAGWRWVVATGSVGALIVWFVRARIPESPRWLVQHGEPARADQVLSRIEAQVAGQLGQELPAPTASFETEIKVGKARLSSIWKGKYISRTIMLVLFHIFQSVGLYGFANWLPSFLLKQGVTLTASLGYTLGIALITPFGPVVALSFADRFERKWQIVLSALVVAAVGLVFAELRSAAPIVIAGGIITMAATTLSLNFHAYQSELYPTSIRARAVGFVFSFSRLSGIFGGFFIASALRHYGVSGALLVIAGSMVMVSLIIATVGPRTRNRSLEALAD